MIDFSPLVERWQGGPLQAWADCLLDQIAVDFHEQRYGDLPAWLDALSELPDLSPSVVELNRGRVSIGALSDCSDAERAALENALRKLHPWRKGPFELFGVHIDTEWRSDWKWDRCLPGLESLEGRRVLDVGCGSGYHCWRALGASASEVIGIDPSPLFNIQFQAVQRYVGDERAWVLPLGIQHVPAKLQAFDTALSMGVLYHRRSPIDHLQELRDCLRGGGQLLLETLVIEGSADQCLVPSGRYARMGNVWFLPSCAMLENWLQKTGFRNVRLVDVGDTSLDEQRSTDWMTFHSLRDFLDAEDHSKTIEGYPAPRRAIFVANAP